MLIIRQNKMAAHRVLNRTSASVSGSLTLSQNVGTFGAPVSFKGCLPQKRADLALGGAWEPTEDSSKIGRNQKNMHRGQRQRKHKSQLGSKEGFLEEVMVKAPDRVQDDHRRGGSHMPKFQGRVVGRHLQIRSFRARPQGPWKPE